MTRKILCLIAIGIFAINISCGQISTKSLSRSEQMGIDISKINSLNLTSPDMRVIDQVDQQRDAKFKMRSCAVLIPVEESFFDKATKISTSKGDLYLLNITSEGALGLNYFSNDFYLPKGAELYVYNPSKTKRLGAFTDVNNSEDGYFAVDYVYGDQMIMEYFQPKEVTQKAKLNIESIGYFYRDIYPFEEAELEAREKYNSDDYRSSGTCNVNVNCSEGNNYRNVQNAVVRIYIPINSYMAGWCTGTVVNNTLNDKKPYILSAAHCIGDISSSSRTTRHSQMIFYFNYQTSGCSTPTTEPGYNSMTGCTYLSHDSRYGSGGSDYWLMQLKQDIPQSYNPYWSGWTITQSPARKGVGIHHPSGDVKKISTFNSSIQGQSASSTYYLASTHWLVRWVRTDNGFGITEGGSSGSGLFNSDNLLVGTLSGGTSNCDSADVYQRDWYGKFYYSYDSIKQWLNPNNSNINQLLGRDYNSSIDEKNISDISISVYPNPAKNYINVNINDNLNNSAVVTILDDLGRIIISKQIAPNQKDLDIDISSLENGKYFVRVYQEGNSVVKQFIKF